MGVYILLSSHELLWPQFIITSHVSTFGNVVCVDSGQGLFTPRKMKDTF